MMKREWIKRLLAVALSLAVAVTFVPLLGDIAFAEGEDETVIEAPATEEVISDDNGVPADNQTEEGVTSEENNDIDVTNDTDTFDDVDSLNLLDDTDSEGLEDAPVAEMEGEFSAKALPTGLSALSGMTYHTQGVFHIEATLKGNASTTNTITKLSIDGKSYKTYSKVNKISENINIRNFSPGEHTVKLEYKYSNTAHTYDGIFPVSIYAVPYGPFGIAVYHNYLDFTAPTFGYNEMNYDMYVDYSTDGQHWQTYGPVRYSQNGKISGLNPNSYYSIRAYYATVVRYNGQLALCQGTDTDSFANWGTYKTGMPTTPKIKSIKVKAYKVKKKTYPVIGYYTGLYLGKAKYYSYKLKIIVKLKKKPGTNGIWINGKKYKGNKKKYTVKLGSFTSYYKPKGKKYTVAIYTYFNDSYGGYSPMYTKVKKIK